MRIERAVGLAFGLAAFLCACSREEAAEGAVEKSPSPIPVHTVADGGVRQAEKSDVLKSERVVTVSEDERTDLASADREALRKIEKAMEDEDVRILRTAMPAAVVSRSTEVRSEAVDALGWFGEKTMDDLLPFMADPDEDIAENALNNWTSALGEVEDEKRKCGMVENVMRVLRNENALESLVMELNDCEQLLALQSVVRLILCDNEVAVKVAREHYEFMTGEEFTTLDAANAWAAENCSDNEEN